MNTTDRLLTTFAYALLGFVLGLLVGFIVLVLTTNHYGFLLLIGAITAAVFAAIRFLVAPYTGPATRATGGSTAPTGIERQRALWGKAVGDAYSKPDAINDTDDR